MSSEEPAKVRPRVTMAELLAKFDPEKHRHELMLDGAPVGTETRWREID